MLELNVLWAIAVINGESGPAALRQLVRETGYSKASVSRAIKSMMDRRIIWRVRRGEYAISVESAFVMSMHDAMRAIDRPSFAKVSAHGEA